MNKKKHNSRYIIIGSIIAVLIMAILVPFTIAYLTDIFDKDTTVTAGKLDTAIYTNNGTQKLDNDSDAYTLTLGAVNAEQAIDLKIKNEGQIEGILKITLYITFESSSVNNADILTTEDANLVNGANWIVKHNFENQNIALPKVYSLTAFYNTKIASGQSVNVSEKITNLLSDNIGKKINFTVRAELISYSGNAYKSGDAISDPFKISDLFNTATEVNNFLQNTWTAWK